MTVNISYFGGAGWQFFTNNGKPLTGGKLYTYAAGTTTPATTYTSSSGSTPNSNPIVLDSAGRVSGEIWLTAGSAYKFVLKTSDDVLIGTYDNIAGVNDITAAFAALAASSGSSLIGYTRGTTGAVARTVQSRLRDFTTVKDFGAVGNGIADDAAAIQAAHDSLPADGGLIYFPAGVYSISQPISITKRNVRFIGENQYNTYISPAATATMDSALVVVGFAFELAYMTIYSPANSGGYCLWSRGAGDLYIHDNNMYNGGATSATGYGMYLDDHDPNGTFVPGAYRHRIIRNAINSYWKPFYCAISTAFGISGGGMNACYFAENQIICDLGFSISTGGGNTFVGNLCQSATGGNSGSRPFTGGVGTALAFGGETQAIGNYFERYEYDFKPTSSSARVTISAHSSDATNNIYFSGGGYRGPAFGNTGYGICAEQLDMYPLGGAIIANNSQLDTFFRAVDVHGNGATYSSIGIETGAAVEGQLFTVYNNSWALSFSGNTLDLSDFGNTLVLGQQGTSVNGILTHGNLATFMFTSSGKWRLIEIARHGPGVGGYDQYDFSGNNETMTVSAPVINISGNGVARTGALIAAGKSYGQTLTLTANSWGVTFAAGAASWSSAGAPTMGNSSGNCQSVQLVYTDSGWIEVSRSVRA